MDELTYSRSGDYLLPDLTLGLPPEELLEPLGKYGTMRRKFLKEHREIRYNSLLLDGTLYQHLTETDQTATARMELLMKELEQKNPPPDKTLDQMAWVQHMNSLRQQAEEVILHELIYS